jgi:hypothetical protein
MQIKRSMKKWIALLTVSLGILVFTSCESDSKNARIEVWLTDAPGDFEEVNVEILGVEVHRSDEDSESGWQALAVEGGVYNLLELTNGLDTLLGSIEIPSGKISQVRLKLGNDNTIKVGGESFDLATPSGQQSGLKLQVHKTLAEGITYKILLDFDVARSIVQTGNESYKLKPVIRTITEAQDGAIKGTVDPLTTPAIYAISGLDTLGTTYADETGNFLIRGLAAGSYDVVFEPNSNYVKTTSEDVTVTLGEVTDLGAVVINE